MVETYSFGYWVLRRRKALDLTREELARRVGCASETIKKIERDERRPSLQIAELLANVLRVPPEEQERFLQSARGQRSADELRLDSGPVFSVPEQPQDLPPQLTPFIGRENELATIDELLANTDCRLLTLVGPGGIGKSRVALRVAKKQISSHRHKVYFLPLAGVEIADALPSVIMNALGLTLNGEVRSQLVHYLQDANRELLLILDNFEQLLAATDLLIEILQATQQVKFLITSRERLNLHSEWVFSMEGLPFPNTETIPDIEQYPAAQLFLETARRVQPDFALTEVEKPFVARICQLVEGMPLAIELAASWTRVLTCQEIVREIEVSIAILATSARDVPERHRNIHAVFDHSWKLLSDEERNVLKQLSIFRGGFTREMAEQVAGASLLTLSSLVDKSLIRVDRRMTDAQRYDLHELIRQYAYERLLEAGEIEVKHTRGRHLDAFLALAENAEPELYRPNSLLWLERLDRDYDNLRAALAWATEPTCSGEKSQRLVRALWLFWRMHGEEGCDWAKRALAQDSPNQSVRAKAMWVAGFLNLFHNTRDTRVAARELLEQSVALCRGLGSTGKRDLALALTFLGVEADRRGDYDSAEAYYEETLVLRQETEDFWGIAQSLNNLAYIAAMRSDFARAQLLLEEGLAAARKVGEPSQIAFLLNSLGLRAISQGDIVRARLMFLESLGICHELRWPWMAGNVFEGLGIMEARHAEEDCLSRAARLWGVAESLFRVCGSADRLVDLQPEIAAVREQLGEAAFSLAWSEGGKMTFDEAIAYALESNVDTQRNVGG